MTEIYKKYCFLLMSIIFLVSYHLISFQGYYGGDDLDYVRLAEKILDRSFSLTSETFSARIVPVGMLALSFSVFGISDFSTVLPFMLVTIGSLLILFFWIKQQTVNIVIFVILFFVTDFYTLTFAAKAYPDVFVVFSTLGIAWVLFGIYCHEFTKALLLLFFLWIGLLSKLTILFVGFPLLFFLIKDVLDGYYRFWIYFAGMFLVSLLIYFGVYWWLTGNPFTRFYNITSNQYTTVCSYHEFPINRLITRLTYEPIFMFINSGMIMVLMASIIYAVKTRSQLSIFFLIYFVTYYFMTTSYEHYLPMCTVEARHFLPLVPLGALLTAQYLENSKRWRSLLIINSTVLIVIFFWLETPLLWIHMLLQAILFFKQSNITLKKPVYVVGVIGVLLLHPLYSVVKHRNAKYTGIQQLIDSNFKGKKILIP